MKLRYERYEKNKIDTGQPYRVVDGLSGGLDPKEYAKLKVHFINAPSDPLKPPETP